MKAVIANLRSLHFGTERSKIFNLALDSWLWHSVCPNFPYPSEVPFI